MIVMSSFDVYLINNYMPFGGGGKRMVPFSHSIPSHIHIISCIIIIIIIFHDVMKENSHLMIGFAERKSCLISLKSSIKKGKYKVEVEEEGEEELSSERTLVGAVICAKVASLAGHDFH